MKTNGLSDIDMGNEIPPTNALSVIGGDSEDFPVLKAFQQYIDAEQTKARKRMMILCGFFAVLMIIVILVFLMLLQNVSVRNQALNDRLIEYVMRERDRPQAAPVVVQQQPAVAPTADNRAALQNLAAQISALQSQLANPPTAKAAETAPAPAPAVTPAADHAAEREIRRLRTQLDQERKKNDAEAARRHAEEIEAYRRTHYPELYAPKAEPAAAKPTLPAAPRKTPAAAPVRKSVKTPIEKIDALLEELDDNDAIDYFADDEDDELLDLPAKPHAIPVEIKGTNANWRIPGAAQS